MCLLAFRFVLILVRQWGLPKSGQPFSAGPAVPVVMQAFLGNERRSLEHSSTGQGIEWPLVVVVAFAFSLDHVARFSEVGKGWT